MKEYKIYAIKSISHPDLQYIGSTNQSIGKRLGQHKSNYKSYINGKYHYVTSFDILKYGNCYIESYCETGAYNKSDAQWFEGQVIRAETCINKNVPSRTTQESSKQYRENNKDKIKKSSKQYYENNKDKIKEYRKNNKDKIKQYNKIKMNCECGAVITYYKRTHHYKTKKHLSSIS